MRFSCSLNPNCCEGANGTDRRRICLACDLLRRSPNTKHDRGLNTDDLTPCRCRIGGGLEDQGFYLGANSNEANLPGVEITTFAWQAIISSTCLSYS